MMQNGVKQSIPLVGGQLLDAPLGKAKVGVGFQALVRKLDETGQFEADARLSGGKPQITPARADYMDATELLEAIRQIVREELAALK